MALNVETYQLAKRNVGGSSDNIPMEILDRIENLENNQMKVHSEFFCNFNDPKYTDLSKTTVILTNEGVVAAQYLTLIKDDFFNDNMVDYDNSFGITLKNENIVLDNSSTIYGELHTFMYEVNKAQGFKFNTKYKNQFSFGSTKVDTASNDELWFTSKIDNYGRLWLLYTKQFAATSTGKVKLVIFNKDMTIYKQSEINANLIFANGTAQYPLFSGSISFTEQNIALVCTSTMASVRNGIGLANEMNTKTENLSILDENGNTRKLVEHNPYSYVGGYLYGYRTGCPNQALYYNKQICFESGGYSNYVRNSGYNYGRCIARYGLRTPDGIDNVNSTISLSATVAQNDPNVISYGQISNFISNMFHRENYFYTFSCLAGLLSSPVNIQHLLLNESLLNHSDDTFLNFLGAGFRRYGVSAPSKTVMYTSPGFNGFYYKKNTNKLYIIGNINNTSALLNRYDVNWGSRNTTSITLANDISKTAVLNHATYDLSRGGDSSHQYAKFIDDGNLIHILFTGPTSVTNTARSLRYMCINYDMDVVIPDTALYTSVSDTTDYISHFEGNVVNGKFIALLSTGNINSTVDVNNGSKILSIEVGRVETSIKFFYATNKNLQWRSINPQDEVLFNEPVDGIKIRAIFESPNYNTSTNLDSIILETWNSENSTSRQSEYHSNRIPTIQNDGKGVLTADYDTGDGVIEWFISFNGGQSYSKVQIGEEFAYTHIQAPDFRVKAVLGIQDNMIKPPIIRSYTLKTSHVVVHSDLEQIQLNLMKTNFKIDTYTNASKNGLFKMTIDTLSDNNGIDDSKSDYTYIYQEGKVTGNYIQTIPEVISSPIKSVLLATDEVHNPNNANSKIKYFVSIDNGVTFRGIEPNVKLQVSSTNVSDCVLIMRAVFYDGAKLSAWGWAWD